MIKDNEILEKLYNSKMRGKIIVNKIDNNIFEVKNTNNEVLMVDSFKAVKNEIERVLKHNTALLTKYLKECIKFDYTIDKNKTFGLNEQTYKKIKKTIDTK